MRRKGPRKHDVRSSQTYRHQGRLSPARCINSRGLLRGEPHLLEVCPPHPGASAQVPEGRGDRVRRQHPPRGRPRIPRDGGAWAGGGGSPPRRSFPMPSWCVEPRRTHIIMSSGLTNIEQSSHSVLVVLRLVGVGGGGVTQTLHWGNVSTRLPCALVRAGTGVMRLSKCLTTCGPCAGELGGAVAAMAAALAAGAARVPAHHLLPALPHRPLLRHAPALPASPPPALKRSDVHAGPWPPCEQ